MLNFPKSFFYTLEAFQCDTSSSLFSIVFACRSVWLDLASVRFVELAIKFTDKAWMSGWSSLSVSCISSTQQQIRIDAKFFSEYSEIFWWLWIKTRWKAARGCSMLTKFLIYSRILLNGYQIYIWKLGDLSVKMSTVGRVFVFELSIQNVLRHFPFIPLNNLQIKINCQLLSSFNWD